MFPASTKGGGMCFAFPDVCKVATPVGPVPTPFPNLAQCAMAINFALKVFIQNMPALHMLSEIPLSSGDEAGALGGVISGVFMQTAKFMVGSPTVLVEGNPGVSFLKSTIQNGTNANAPTGSQLAPSQAVVIYGS